MKGELAIYGEMTWACRTIMMWLFVCNKTKVLQILAMRIFTNKKLGYVISQVKGVM